MQDSNNMHKEEEDIKMIIFNKNKKEPEYTNAMDEDERSDIENENCVGPILNFQFEESSSKEKSEINNNLQYTISKSNSIKSSIPVSENFYLDEKNVEFKPVNLNQEENTSKQNKQNENSKLQNQAKDRIKTIETIKRNDLNPIPRHQVERFSLFASRVSHSIQKTEAKKKLLAKRLEEEELRECSFRPQILRASSHRNFNSKLNKSTDYIEQISKREKFKFTERLKKDITCLNSMKSKPSIQRNYIFSSNRTCSMNVFEKLSTSKKNIKEIKESPENFPFSFPFSSKFKFKPTIRPYIRRKDFSDNPEFKFLVNKAVNNIQDISLSKQKIEKLLQKKDEKMDSHNDMHAKRKLEKEIKYILNELSILEEDISKDEMICLLSKLSFISNSIHGNDQTLLNKFWEISLGNQKEKAKLSNFILILLVIMRLIKSSIFDINPAENNSETYLVNQKGNASLIKQAEISKFSAIELTFHEGKEINQKKRFFKYDENGNLLLVQNDIFFLRKYFIAFYCKRFCLKGKEKGISNPKVKSQLNNSNSSIKSKLINSKKEVPFLYKELYKSSKKASSRVPLTSEMKKEELIHQISMVTPLKECERSTKKLKMNKSSRKTTERLYYCKKRKKNNKEVRDPEYEKSIPELTFSPNISRLISKSPTRLRTKIEEKSIEQMQKAKFDRAMSVQRPFYESKRGQTAIKNDFEFKKFGDEYKNLRDSDKILKNLVIKYASNQDLSSNNVNKDMSIDKISKLLNEESKKSKESKTNDNLNKIPKPDNQNFNKSLIPKRKIQLNEDNCLNTNKKQAEKIARIEINTSTGQKIIKVRQGENIHTIARNICIENQLDYQSEKRIYNFLKEQVRLKFL